MWVWKTKADVPKGTIVMVHGAGEHHGRYDWLADQWLSQGFNVVIGDLPGQGENPRHQGHVDRFDEYIECVQKWANTAKAFKEPILLFGHSLGGLVIIRLLEETTIRPRAVLLSSPCLGLMIPPPEWIKKAVRPLNNVLPRLRIPIKRSADNHWATHNEEILKKDADDSLIVKKVSLRWYYELDQAMALAFERQSRFPDVPLFIFQAGDDKIVDRRAVYRWFDSLPIHRKHYKEWPLLYHEVFNEPEREKVFLYALKCIHPLFGSHK